MRNQPVSLNKLYDILQALDKHFPFKDWSFSVQKDVKGRKRAILCWRVVRPHKTIVFSLHSRPLSRVPAWAYYAVIYRYEKSKNIVLGKDKL